MELLSSPVVCWVLREGCHAIITILVGTLQSTRARLARPPQALRGNCPWRTPLEAPPHSGRVPVSRGSTGTTSPATRPWRPLYLGTYYSK